MNAASGLMTFGPVKDVYKTRKDNAERYFSYPSLSFSTGVVEKTHNHGFRRCSNARHDIQRDQLEGMR